MKMMIKTIKVKKEFTFRELMEYIIQNDVSGRFKNDMGYGFSVNANSNYFSFDENFVYGRGETYEVEVEEEIPEDMEFGNLIEVTNSGDVFVNRGMSIKMRSENSRQFYILLDGELVKIWERE